MSVRRFGVIGAGFWAPYQLAAWRELPAVECVAICDLYRSRAQALADRFGVPGVYDDPARLLREESLDFVDVITGPDHHAPPVWLAAQHGVAVICQKPMAPALDLAEGMVSACQSAGVPFLIHENWRWQAPIRAVKHALDRGVVGRAFRGRIQFSCSFPVFENQPALKSMERFILTDIGSHLFDVVRFLFGEAQSVACHTSRVHGDIRGEDVATALVRMASGAAVSCEMSYASRLEDERFPETYVLVEGELGSLALGPGCEVRVTTATGTESAVYEPRRYDWVDPAYALVQSSIVDCNRNLLASLRGDGPAETHAADNLRTLGLVFAAYESAARGETVHLSRC